MLQAKVIKMAVPAKLNCQKRSYDATHASVLDKIKEIKDQITSVLEVKGSTNIPIGLLVSLKDTFKCNLCRCTVRPPLITTRCCKNILGCDSCASKLILEVEEPPRHVPFVVQTVPLLKLPA